MGSKKDAKEVVAGAVASVRQLVKEGIKTVEGERQCKAKARVRDAEGNPILGEDGKPLLRPCRRKPIKGGTVCYMHGGAAPAVKAKAAKRWLAMVDPAFVAMEDLVTQTEHRPTQLAAARTVFERAGTDTPIGAMAKETGEKDMRPVIQIGIAVGGIATKPEIAVTPAVNVGLIPAKVAEIVGDEE